jgi:integrase/recombinase XerD
MEEVQKYITELKLEGRMSENTIRSYAVDLNKVASFAHEKGIFSGEELTSDFLAEYIEKLKDEGKSASTIARKIVSIKSFCKYLCGVKKLKYDISENLKSPKVEGKAPEILTRTQIKKLFEMPESNSPKGQRDLAILNLLYATGIKVSELAKLKLEDLDMQIGSIEVRGAKRERMIPFDKATRDVLMSYLNEGRRHLITSTSESLLFVNYKGESISRQGLWKMLRTYAKEAGLDMTITPEMLRHSFAAHMVERGADLDAVQFMMGHVSPSSMKKYAKETKDYIRDVYNSTHI